MKKLTTVTFIALLLLVGYVKAEGIEVRASSHENIETFLKLESWMTSETLWNSKSTANSFLNLETESNLELQSWMTSEKTWNLNFSFIEETDSALALENWMTSDKAWNVKNDDNCETELKVENWMTDNKAWK